MLNITELAKWVEEAEFLFLITVAIVEVGIDLICHNKRNYLEPIPLLI